jgi:uncharacterized protein YjbJ (UPF0337 family)
MKSARRDRTEGTVDRVAGKVLEFFSRVTGRPVAGVKGKAARGRGAGRTARGRARRGAR